MMMHLASVTPGSTSTARAFPCTHSRAHLRQSCPRGSSRTPLSRGAHNSCLASPRLVSSRLASLLARPAPPTMDAALGLLGLGSPCEITITLDGASTRRYFNQALASPPSLHAHTAHALVQQHNHHAHHVHAHPHAHGVPSNNALATLSASPHLLPLFTETETVSGQVTVAMRDGKTLHHRGVKIEFVGTIEMLYDRDNSQEFTTLERMLDDPGILNASRTYPFEFTNVEKCYDTYSGINVRLRYFLRVTAVRAQYTPDLIEELDICVQHCVKEPPSNLPIRMEVGIEDALHIEFEYNKSKFHLRDVVIGKIYFLLVRISIKRMEVEIRKRESAGSGANVYNETDTVMKFEVMDGAPVPGESIPVRMFLGACKALTPTYRSINNKFSVKYFLNLVLVDEDDRRYFKQSEITIWRAAFQTV